MISVIINPLNKETAISGLEQKGYTVTKIISGKNNNGTLRMKLFASK